MAAIRRKPVDTVACRALPKLQVAAQELFLKNYDLFRAEIKHSNPSYAIKLLATADRLAGKKIRLTKEAHKVQVDHSDLVEKVLLSLLEDVDDSNLTSTSDLIDIAFLLERM